MSLNILIIRPVTAPNAAAPTPPPAPGTVKNPSAQAIPQQNETAPATPEDSYTAPDYTAAAPATKINAAEDKDLTTLGKLSPFQDIAVIQPRYLPRNVAGRAYAVRRDDFKSGFFHELRFEFKGRV